MMNTDTLIDRLAGYAPVLLQGAGMTLVVSSLAIVVGFVLGTMLLGLAQSKGWGRFGQRAVAVYVSIFRGTPLLVQLLMCFYLPSAFGLNLHPLVVAIGVMGMNSAAFQCEILRAGLAAVPKGQLEAAISFGMSPRRVFHHVQLPQMARAVWPAVVSEAIDVVKNSAIVSVIAVAELTRAARQIAAANFRPLEVYISAGMTYLLLTGAVFLLGSWLGRRLWHVRVAQIGLAKEKVLAK